MCNHIDDIVDITYVFDLLRLLLTAFTLADMHTASILTVPTATTDLPRPSKLIYTDPTGQ